MSKVKSLEKNRFSLLTKDLSKCIICGQPKEDINEIFMGRNRQNSMRYGLCIPMCRKCHQNYHNDRKMQLYFMNLGLGEFLKSHTLDDFQKTFGYIKGLDIF